MKPGDLLIDALAHPGPALKAYAAWMGGWLLVLWAARRTSHPIVPGVEVDTDV